MTGKPAAQALGIDLDSLAWRSPDSSGPVAAERQPGAIQVAMTARPEGGTWVLLRVSGDDSDRVLVYDEHEWRCFLDGVRKGEFDVAGG